jgi:hypothetical protein
VKLMASVVRLRYQTAWEAREAFEACEPRFGSGAVRRAAV